MPRRLGQLGSEGRLNQSLKGILERYLFLSLSSWICKRRPRAGFRGGDGDSSRAVRGLNRPELREVLLSRRRKRETKGDVRAPWGGGSEEHSRSGRLIPILSHPHWDVKPATHSNAGTTGLVFSPHVEIEGSSCVPRLGSQWG